MENTLIILTPHDDFLRCLGIGLVSLGWRNSVITRLGPLAHVDASVRLFFWWWNLRKTMMLEKRLAIVQKWYGPLREILFMCILAPFFITGVVSLGRLKQCEMALDRISDSFSFLVENYSSLSSYRAVVDRLYNFRSSCLALTNTNGVKPDEIDAGSESQGMDAKTSNRTEVEIIQRLAPFGIPPRWPPFWGGCSNEDRIHMPPSIQTDLSLDASIYLPSGDLLIEDVHLQVGGL